VKNLVMASFAVTSTHGGGWRRKRGWLGLARPWGAS